MMFIYREIWLRFDGLYCGRFLCVQPPNWTRQRENTANSPTKNKNVDRKVAQFRRSYHALICQDHTQIIFICIEFICGERKLIFFFFNWPKIASRSLECNDIYSTFSFADRDHVRIGNAANADFQVFSFYSRSFLCILNDVNCIVTQFHRWHSNWFETQRKKTYEWNPPKYIESDTNSLQIDMQCNGGKICLSIYIKRIYIKSQSVIKYINLHPNGENLDSFYLQFIANNLCRMLLLLCFHLLSLCTLNHVTKCSFIKRSFFANAFQKMRFKKKSRRETVIYKFLVC